MARPPIVPLATGRGVPVESLGDKPARAPKTGGDTDLLYPSMVVNIRLRFDETFRVDTEIPEPGPQQGDPTAVMVPAASDPTAKKRRPPVVSIGNAYQAPVAGDYASNTRPLITQAGKDTFIVNRVPKSANIELPGTRQAGKFMLEFDWRELPIDPRLIRAASVEVYCGSVSPEDFSTGMTTIQPDGSRRSVLNTLGADGLPRLDLMTITGAVDIWSSTHSQDGSIVRLEGRDLRGHFLDSPVDPDVLSKLDLTRPVTQVIADILSKHPAAQYMKILYSPQDWDGGEPPSVVDSDGLTRVRRNADGNGASAGAQGDNMSFWDIITRYCFLAEAVPYFRGHDLIIRPVRSIYDESKPSFSSRDPVFATGTRSMDDGSLFTERKMVFGRNIKELSFERKLAGTKVPVVQAVSWDTSSTSRGARKLLTEEWPPADAELARVSGVHPSGEVSQTDKLVIPPRFTAGIRDRNKLLGLCRAVYEEVGRGELGGSCRTGAMASYKGDNSDPDLMRLRPSDQVEFTVDIRQLSSSAPNVSTYTDDARRSFESQVAEVKQALSGKANGGDENLARVLVASARSTVIDLLRKFRVANVVFSWSLTQGIQVSFDFQNYFVIRYGINEQLGKNVIPPVVSVISSNKAKRPKVKMTPRPVMKANPRRPSVTIGPAKVGD